ncbi:MAG: hypothetical protein AB7E80_08850 [Hyphomicrobiaceae bacterium]
MSEPAEPGVEDVALIQAPYRREIVLQNVTFDSGMQLLRVRIREGRRFTILDVDAETARAWGNAMTAWADRQNANAPPAGANDTSREDRDA